MLISGLIPLLQQPGLMLEMKEQPGFMRHKLLDFFTDALPKLADAELRAEAEPDVRTWLDDLNAVAYEADDIVDDFRYAKLQAEAEADGCRNQNGDRVRAGLFLLSCFKSSSNNRSGALQGIENRISSIVNKIDDLDERMRAFNFRPGQEINITSLERPQQLNFSSPTEIVGRDNEIRGIIEIIKHRPKGFFQWLFSFIYPTLIFIVGPQGIGKTALARFVCNHAYMKSEFDCVVWVDVGSEFNIGKITKSIIDQVIGKDCCISEGDTDLLELRLSQELYWSKCIVVLDDVRTVHKELILKFNKLILTSARRKIRLIVTSTFQEVGQMFDIGSMTNCVLEPLMDNDDWNLFCKKAFWDDANETCPEILKEMGKKIVDTCGGSPLALNMMGGLMRFKKQPEEWRRVINQLENYTVDGVATVEKIIKVCYDNLCSQVKQCFAFCSLFPEGHYMDKEVLIKLWMANGLLLPSDGSRSMPPEENGSIVFNELVSRHFFEEDVKLIHGNYSYENKHGYHRVTCKLLDLVRKQAVIAAREFALRLSISGDSQVDIPILLENNPAVRTLLSPGDPFIRKVNCSTVPRANSLRGLHLHSALFQQDLFVLKYMRHLRYLDLSGSRIKMLPESTSLLYFLQTLNLSNCLLLYQLPENMKYMRSLRHLYIHKCPKLKKMPAHFRQLNNLQTLTTYIVGEENTGTGIDQIKGLHLGGLLELYNLHKVKTVTIAKEADLVSKTNLDRLTLNWGTESVVMSTDNNDLGVLKALQPHTQLKVLKVQQYGGRKFATWLAHPVEMGFVNFVELHLIGCSQCKTLPALWKLPSLRVLCLKHMPSLTCISRTDKKDSSEQFFPSLKRLVLVGLKKLERWHEEVLHTKIGGGEIEEEEEGGETKEEEEGETEEEEEGGETKEEEEGGETKEEKERGGGATCSNLETTFEEVIEFTMLDQLEITSCPNLKTMPRVPQLKHITASIENYRLLWSVTNVITRAKSLVEEANIAKASSADNEQFPALEEKGEKRVPVWSVKLRILRMDSTNSFFMPTTLPHSLLGLSGLWRSFEALTYLEIINCNTLVSWPLEFIYLERLIRLSIRMCPNLTGKLPAHSENNYWWLFSLKRLEFYGCSSLKQVPKCGCRHLNVLELDECPQVESISGIERVDMLYLSCISWTSLPSWLPEIKELGTLWVSECPMVKELPGGEWLSSLKKLKISECPDLEKFCKEEPYSSIISQIGKKNDEEDDSEFESFEEESDEEDASDEEEGPYSSTISQIGESTDN
ncbi:disease resistance protein RGA3 [Carex littledalei]|uniref:Disease resistance protein RGA3 n=1 Tax=Carex littledalei TaxID=544730 RepID=A0A833RIP8_9POAL|nr:disease resistance protein RGA3 [Carex littledalei]